MRTLFISILLLCFIYGTYSQDHYRVLELEYEYSSNNNYDSIKENSIDIQEYEANLSFPIKRENGDAILTGFGTNNMKMFPKIESNDRPSDTVYSGDYSFSRIRIQAGYSKKINDERSIVGMGYFRIASDLIDVSSKDFLYAGLVLITKKKSERFTLKYGLYASTEYYGWLIVPAIGCDWKVSEKFRIYGVMPRRLSVVYTLNKRFRTGLIFEAPNRTYNVNESLIVDAAGTKLDTYVHNVKNVVYAFGEVYLSKSIVLRARVGYTIGRKIGLYERQDANTYYTWGLEYGAKRTAIADVPAHRTFQDGLVLNASLEYRFSLE